MTCAVCERVKESGWIGQPGSHCLKCHREWTSLKEAHCSVCHEHFASPTAFDLHLKSKGCAHPSKAKYQSGARQGELALELTEQNVWRMRAARTSSDGEAAHSPAGGSSEKPARPPQTPGSSPADGDS